MNPAIDNSTTSYPAEIETIRNFGSNFNITQRGGSAPKGPRKIPASIGSRLFLDFLNF